MHVIEASEVHQTMNFEELIPAIEQTFAGTHGMPQRNVFSLQEGSDHGEGFAVLPAWNSKAIGVKAFTYFPKNAPKGLDSLYSKILMFKRETGEPLALVDGSSVTYWRTAAVSALGSQYLSRKNASRLLVCGTGNLASYMALAHATVRPITHIDICGRSLEKAEKVAEQVRKQRPEITVVAVTDIESATRQADIISCATGAGEPLILGEWVKPGTHCDFVGNHSPKRRECDTDLITQASVFVDSRLNVLNEAGELLIPIEEGLFSKDDVKAELTELARGQHNGRQTEEEITVFKTVGTALSDLAAACLVVEKLTNKSKSTRS
ncbi:ornithine cyclodeaminase family protein [Psychromonas sp.]|uniref:ornithine cyclodeaminase family protein n=1 Tax=Psychromonas sp. TaxID=1884585 RepID=UPI0039E235B7